MKLLWKALSDKLRSIPAVVAATAYSEPDNLSIIRVKGETKFKQKGLFFEDLPMQPLQGSDADELFEGLINLHCVGKDEEEASDIQKSLTDIFRQANPPGFLDISNDDIISIRTGIDDLETIMFNKDLDIWIGTVTIFIKWSYS